jgi:hypothetical protein
MKFCKTLVLVWAWKEATINSLLHEYDIQVKHIIVNVDFHQTIYKIVYPTLCPLHEHLNGCMEYGHKVFFSLEFFYL